MKRKFKPTVKPASHSHGDWRFRPLVAKESAVLQPDFDLGDAALDVYKKSIPELARDTFSTGMASMGHLIDVMLDQPGSIDARVAEEVIARTFGGQVPSIGIDLSESGPATRDFVQRVVTASTEAPGYFSGWAEQRYRAEFDQARIAVHISSREALHSKAEAIRSSSDNTLRSRKYLH